MTDVAPTTARNAVVSAALDLFVAQGFEATSVEQIAQAAGVSRSTFFRQFGGKDDVVFSDHDAKGFLLLTLTHEDAKAELMAVSTIHAQVYETRPVKTFRLKPEAKGVSGLIEA